MSVNGYECGKEGASLSSIVPSDRTRGNGYTLKHTKYQLYTRKHFYCEGGQTRTIFTERSVEIFNVRLDTVLGKLLKLTVLSRERSFPAEMIL